MVVRSQLLCLPRSEHADAAHAPDWRETFRCCTCAGVKGRRETPLTLRTRRPGHARDRPTIRASRAAALVVRAVALLHQRCWPQWNTVILCDCTLQAAVSCGPGPLVHPCLHAGWWTCSRRCGGAAGGGSWTTCWTTTLGRLPLLQQRRLPAAGASHLTPAWPAAKPSSSSPTCQ